MCLFIFFWNITPFICILKCIRIIKTKTMQQFKTDYYYNVCRLYSETVSSFLLWLKSNKYEFIYPIAKMDCTVVPQILK